MKPNTVQPNVAAAPPVSAWNRLKKKTDQPAYEQQQIAAPAPIVQELVKRERRRHRVGDVATHLTQPKTRTLLAPRARSVAVSSRFPAEAPVGAPGGRGPGEPLDLANTGAALASPGRCRLPVAAPVAGAEADHLAAFRKSEG